MRFNPADKRLYVANGKGTTPKANAQGPQPAIQGKTVREYIARPLSRHARHPRRADARADWKSEYKQAYACSPLQVGRRAYRGCAEGQPIPGKVGDPSPIKHCIYIIKENRTYDQVFGDMQEGNGDPELCLFPEKVTPNHHKLAREFVLLDNFYVEGEVSADGHEWTMGAYATDFVEKVWPLSYRGSPLKKLSALPVRGRLRRDRPAGGRLHLGPLRRGRRQLPQLRRVDRQRQDAERPRHRRPSRRSKGTSTRSSAATTWTTRLRSGPTASSRNLKRFEKEGEMPRLIVLRLPNDHTSGTRVGKPTPTAMVADNDLALGQVVEAVSKSKFWTETAIFVVEDDAQNGSDHVDAHRTVALVISPYTKRSTSIRRCTRRAACCGRWS